MQAIELARRHGWTEEPAAGIAYAILAIVLAWRGRLDEAEPWIQRAERTVRPEAEPIAGVLVCYGRGLLELARGHHADALVALRAAERLAGLLAAPHLPVTRVRALQLQAMVRLGETERAERAIAELGEQERERGQIRIATAVLRLAQDRPHAATQRARPGPRRFCSRNSFDLAGSQAFMLEATARDALGDPAAAGRALERALDLAEPDSTLSAFLIHPVPALLERYARHSTRHAALISEILDLLPRDQRPGGPGGMAAPQDREGLGGSSPRLAEPLSQGEIRVLRYMPTNLSTPEIARELSLSVHTVRTHVRHLFAKLGAHGRTEAVARARALGLLAPSGRTT